MSVSAILAKSHLVSSEKKKTQAEKLLLEYASRFGFEDTKSVCVDSFKLVLNILYDYSAPNDGDIEKVNRLSAVNGIIIGLRWAYYEHGHRSNWTVPYMPDGRIEVSGNPLDGNADIVEFHKMMARKLAEMSNFAKSSALYKTEHIVEHEKEFLMTDKPDTRDFLLHAFQLTAMNCSMRYDELMKLKMDSFKCTKHVVSFSVQERTKTKSNARRYVLRTWPGSVVSNFVLMDTRIALTFCILARGDAPGFLFCNIAGVHSLRIMHDEPWTKRSYIEFMRIRLQSICISPVHATSVTGHSGRRGGVQLLRFLGVKDVCIMNWFGMKGGQSYIRYTDICSQNDDTPLPDFNSSDSLLAHANNTRNIQPISEIHSYVEVQEWLEE